MRLSNVQYYFKSRDDVLTAMIARYFEECTATLLKLTENSGAQTQRERLDFLIRSGLSHGQEISDMCRAFREIWAISSRNQTIDNCLMEYYRNFGDVIADFVFRDQLDETARARFISLLVPYFEGYSITARSSPLNTDEVVEMLTKIALASLKADV